MFINLKIDSIINFTFSHSKAGHKSPAAEMNLIFKKL